MPSFETESQNETLALIQAVGTIERALGTCETIKTPLADWVSRGNPIIHLFRRRCKSDISIDKELRTLRKLGPQKRLSIRSDILRVSYCKHYPLRRVSAKSMSRAISPYIFRSITDSWITSFLFTTHLCYFISKLSQHTDFKK